ncbi:MAG TPA: HD-GYP domain-containing protein [Methylophilaceae bacterium]|jgi:HD-GYP domain-containing protein (c-di-GMP phosphodiesterase class II)
MLKRIDVKHLRVGMYLHELCGKYMDHPFWRSKFMLEDKHAIDQLLSSPIKEVVIDTEKGLDVAVVEPRKPAPPSPPPVKKAVAHASLKEEMEHAANVCNKAKHAVTSMFNELRMGSALDANNAVPIVEEISNSVMRNPGALISLARLKTKDDYTYMHSVAVCALMVSLSKQLGLDEATTHKAGMAGLLHDAGKMMIPSEILDKPGKLTNAEFKVIQGHPMAGYKLLSEGKGVDETSLDVVRHHHEKVDGSGYPDGLKNGEISMFAKMSAVCDVYDAITSNRPYKTGWDPAESLKRMAEWSKGHFDDHIFQAFVKSIGIYPIGSLVRMQSGRIGVVVGQHEKSLLAPMVRVFFSTKSNLRIAPELIDLSASGLHDKILATEDSTKWDFPDLDDLWQGADI